MKKITFSLTLILCLVLCVFAFASCGPKKPAGGTTPSTTTAKTECNHVWGEFEVDTPATCSAPGVKSRYCTLCDAQDPDSITAIPTIPHTPGEEFVVDTEPTCTDGGFKSKHCTVCGLPVADTVLPIDPDPTKHKVEVWSTEPTLLNPVVHRTGECTLCHQEQAEDATFKHDVQVFTTAGGRYTAGGATLGEIRGDKHFYEAGNDLLVEYSILWNETLLNMYKNNMATIDTRIASTPAGTSGNSGIVRWELADDIKSEWCTSKFAGAFEVAALETSEPDSPYPRFDTTLDDVTAYPNIGGANAGDGQPLGETQWGWHRVSIRYRNEVTNVDAVKAGDDATYKLQVWVYIDGVLVLHNSATDHKWNGEDRKLFSAAPDGEGGIVYTENDALYLHGAFLDSRKMASGTGYFEIADYSVTVGADFVQNVTKMIVPVPDTLDVAEGVSVPSTMWYVAVHDHVPAAEYTEDVPATCTVAGSKSYHCTICGAIIAETVTPIEPLASGGHTPAENYTVDREPTCIALGSKSKHCTVCHEIIPETVEPIDMIAHVAKDDYTIDVPATCTTEGSKSKHCAVCDVVLADTIAPVQTDPNAHVVDSWTTTVQPTLLADGTKTGTCTLCSSPAVGTVPYVPDVQVFTSAKGKYSPNHATLGEIRGSEHFYDEGNDLLIEYSILWNETLPTNMYKSSGTWPCVDTRLASNEAGTTGNSCILRLDLVNDIPSEWVICRYAGGIEVGALETSEADSPYPRFNQNVADITAYPNIGGANAGDGTELGETRWGWHRVSIRYRNEVTNVEEVKAGAEATYKLQAWVYVDGDLIVHFSGTDHKWNAEDRKLFSAASDGEGGIVYTENDALYLHGAFLDSKRTNGEKSYYAIADYSATIGSTFVQDVKKATSPDLDAKLEVESGVFVPATMWYEAK